MTIALDKFTKFLEAGANPSGMDSAPVGTVAGILVCIGTAATATSITAVSIGGVSLTEVTGSPQASNSGEVCEAAAWFLGDASALAGRSDDLVDTTGSAQDRVFGIYTFTATGDTSVVDTYTDTTPTTKTTSLGGTLSLSGNTCFCAQAIASGTNGNQGKVSTITNWSKDITADNDDSPDDIGDFGGSSGEVHSYDIVSTSDVTCGFTQNNDDASLVAVAIKDDDGAGGGIFKVIGEGGVASTNSLIIGSGGVIG